MLDEHPNVSERPNAPGHAPSEGLFICLFA